MKNGIEAKLKELAKINRKCKMLRNSRMHTKYKGCVRKCVRLTRANYER